MVNARIAHLRIAPWWAILSTSFIRIAHPNYNISFHSVCLIKGGTPSITYDPHHNCFDILKIFHLGVGHGDDLAYIFPMAQLGLPKSVTTPAQQKTRQNFLQLLHSFATSGKPTLDDEQVLRKKYFSSW